VNAGGEGDVVMTPRLEAGEWRAVLEWGAKPLDLDAYAKWGSGKVYSANAKRTAKKTDCQACHRCYDRLRA
jgi:hypothetical protein